MSTIKTTSIIKLVCGGIAAAITIAACATPLAPLAICVAVFGAIAFGAEALELVHSLLHNDDAIVPRLEINKIDNTDEGLSISNIKSDDLYDEIDEALSTSNLQSNDLYITEIEIVGSNVMLSTWV